jgi:hypothetical protein
VLRERRAQIIQSITGVKAVEAEVLLEQAGGGHLSVTRVSMLMLVRVKEEETGHDGSESKEQRTENREQSEQRAERESGTLVLSTFSKSLITWSTRSVTYQRMGGLVEDTRQRRRAEGARSSGGGRSRHSVIGHTAEAS